MPALPYRRGFCITCCDLLYRLHQPRKSAPSRLIAPLPRWYNSLCDVVHKVAAGIARPSTPGEAGTLEFANLPHDFAETLELVFVGITIVVSLAIMVAFGAWWQR